MPIFIAALFITVKIWKQPVSLNRLIVDKQDMVYVRNHLIPVRMANIK